LINALPRVRKDEHLLANAGIFKMRDQRICSVGHCAGADHFDLSAAARFDD
jgi:hypothetical protein